MLTARRDTRRLLKPLSILGLLAALLTLLLFLLTQGQPAHAATITVNSTADVTADDGVCTLREAITGANTDTASGATPGECPAGSGPDTIDVPADTYTLAIPGAGEDANASGDLDITADLTINGAAAASTILQACDSSGGPCTGIDRVIHIAPGVTAAISGVNIQNGFALTGGGILNGGTLTLNSSTVSANSATGDIDVGGGGGIRNGGALTLTSSTVSGNSASVGGGIFSGFSSFITLTLTDSTVSDNTGGCCGGGILNGGTLTLNSSSVSGNSASNGGGIRNEVSATLKNTIVANSPSGGDCLGSITSAGHNLDSDNTCNLTAAGDLPGVNPLLGPLADNGGPTQTHALLPGSPAIDAGSPDCPPPATDQRGVARPQGAACDIGAYERGVFTISAQAGAHGTITPSGLITVNEGGSQAFTMTPDANYHVADVFVRSWLPSQIMEVPSVVSSYESGCTSVFRLTGEFAGATFTGWFDGVDYTIGLDESRAELAAFVGGTRAGSVSVEQIVGNTRINVMPDNAPSFNVVFNALGCVISGHVLAFISETSGVVRVVEGVVGSSAGAVTLYTFSDVAANHTIDASFAIDTHSLTVTRAGTGTGTILSLPQGIDCASDCTEQYDHGTEVALVALPDEASTFTGWSDACTGTGTCVVTMDQDRGVTATFVTPRTYTITATAGENGTITPSGALTVEHGGSQTFTITPDTGYRVADVLVGAAQTPTLETVRIVGLYESGCASVFRFTGEFSGASFTNRFGPPVNYVIGPDPPTAELALFAGGTRVGSVGVSQMDGATFIIVMPDNAPSFTVAFNALGCVISGHVLAFISEAFGISGTDFPFIFGIGEETLTSVGAVNSYTFGNVVANHTVHATFEVDPDTDGDGVPNTVDACPNDPEDFDSFQDADGCPDPDNDGDGILDVNDACPNEPEDFDSFQDGDGCPEPCPGGDVNGDGRVDLRDVVLVGRALGSRPGDRRWNPAADLNHNGRVDLGDLSIVVRSSLDPTCQPTA